MKLKKVLTVLFTTLLLLTLSSSAFASEITPTAVGIGDTKESAITLVGNSEFNLFLSDSADKDWFKWTNNTSEYKLVAGYFMPDSKVANYRLGMEINYSPSVNAGRVYAENYGPGNAQIIDNILIPPGASVYYVIDSTEFALMQYTFIFRIYNFN
ncbi:hypothetical protein [Paenibacillus motobuensis]|uniref:Uncharacterized protein n=1 Tax=Paenibacillus motobuensis TaxID=295324 RepID=A0ABN0YC55_9BACL